MLQGLTNVLARAEKEGEQSCLLESTFSYMPKGLQARGMSPSPMWRQGVQRTGSAGAVPNALTTAYWRVFLALPPTSARRITRF